MSIIKNQISKCLFPAAGYGTRFLPATKAVPKEMLPILTKPLLQYGVEEALSSGIYNMAIVTGRGKRSIEDHFDNSYELEAQLKGTSKEHLLKEVTDIIHKTTFSYVRQQKMLGLGDAILTGYPLIGDDAFAVILADDLCHNDSQSILSQMISIYNKFKCSIVAIEEIDSKDSNKYGIIKGVEIERDIFDITDMIEKPEPSEAPSKLAIIGRYILTPDIFPILRKVEPDKNGEVQLTDALRNLAHKDRIIGYCFKGKRFDCGSLEGFIKANNFFAKKLGII